MRITALPSAALLVAVCLSAPSFAGVYLESARKDLAEPKATAKVSKMWFDGGRMRSEAGGERGDIAVFKNRTMYVIDPGKKTYSTIDQTTVNQLGDRMAEAKKKREAQLATLPPERRAMVEKMMGQMGGGAPGAAGAASRRVLKNTGRSDKVAGISCTVWEASVDGKKEEELCAAKAGAIPGGDEVMKTLKEIGEMLKGFTRNAAFKGSAASEPWRDMETINGVPILSRDFENGKATAETRLLVARKESMAGAQFEVPAGYTEKKINFGAGPAK